MKIIDLIKITNIFKPDMKFDNIQTGYKIMKFLKSAENDISFYNNKLTEILNECAEKNGNDYKRAENEGIIISKDKINVWQDKMSELSSIEVDIKPPNFKLEEFGNCNFSIAELNALEPLILE